MSPHDRPRAHEGARPIKHILELLVRHPEAGTRTTHLRLRRLVAYPYHYLIFYEATAIVVHGVRHAARKPDDFRS